MTKITVEGTDYDKISKELAMIYKLKGKIVRHYREGQPEEIPHCDVAIIEKKTEVKI